MIKFIFFDVAQTLLWKPTVYSEVKAFCKKNGVNITNDEIIKRHRILSEVTHFPDKTSKEFYINFNYKLLLALGFAATKNLAEELFNNCSYKPWSAFEDCLAIKDLNVQVGVLSNWDKSLADKLSEFFPQIQFAEMVISSVVGYQKPSQEIFDHAIKASGVEPSEIIFVGDSIRLDYVPARDAGIRSVLLDRDKVFEGFNGERIESIQQLKDII